MKDSSPFKRHLAQVSRVGILFISLFGAGNVYAQQESQENKTTSNASIANTIKTADESSPLARALKGNKEKVTSISGDEAIGHWLTIKPVELKDNSGLVYLGGRISKAQIDVYLNKMKTTIGDDFATFRQNQAARDHHTFHVTLINPYEYQHIDKQQVDLNKGLAVELLGVGTVSNETDTAYYVVVNSSDGQYFRQQLKLNKKDFHITLGFNKSDVYDRKKDRSTLIK